MRYKRWGAAALAFCLLLLSACSGSPAQPETTEPEEPDSPVVSIQPEEEPTAAPQATGTPEPTATPHVFDPSLLEDMPDKDEYLRLRGVNGDVVGWITVPNTVINYPVVLGEDNDYYLKHTPERESSKSGSIFFDYRNSREADDRHIILYGHNMRNGSMFHDLPNYYRIREFFDNSREITLWVGDEERVYEVYASFIATEDIYFIRTKFKSDETFLSYMQELQSLAKYPTDTVLTAQDQILTLCTCTYEETNARGVVQARRIR